MKNWSFNFNRLREVFRTEAAREAIETFLTYKRPEVVKTIAALWGVLLVMVFTMVFTIRLALSIPLF